MDKSLLIDLNISEETDFRLKPVDIRAVLSGVHYSDGMRIESNNLVLFCRQFEYPEELEGYTVFPGYDLKKKEYAAYKPVVNRVLDTCYKPKKIDIQKIFEFAQNYNIELEDFIDSLDLGSGLAEREFTKEFIGVVKLADGYYVNLRNLVLFAKACGILDCDLALLPDGAQPMIAYADTGYVVLSPLCPDREFIASAKKQHRYFEL